MENLEAKEMFFEATEVKEVSVAEPVVEEPALEEITKLKAEEARDLDYLPKPIKFTHRKSNGFLKAFLICFVAFVILFFVAARLVFGKGWIQNAINKTGNFTTFTIPVAQHPEIEESFYQPDGRFTVEGVAKACSASIVTVEAYLSEDIYTGYGQGSGIIMTKDGYIITNAHVIDGATFAIIVRTNDGTEYSATVVGSDIKSDIAVLKINATDLQPAQFGDSDQLNLGEQVVALGSPAGLETSVTTGIVSGLERMIKVESYNISMPCVQIDAAINPGNSGGALFNMWGQVVGITSSKMVSAEYDGIGFAITMQSAKPIIEELIENGKILGRVKIGISFYEVSETQEAVYGILAGLHIADIAEDCDIANTDLQIDDIITHINGIRVTCAEDVFEIIYQYKAGDEMTAKVTRYISEDKIREFEITFKLMPDTSAEIQPESEVEIEE